MRFCLDDLITTKQALMDGEISLENFHEELEEKRNEKLIQISQSMPNLMAEIPEEKKLIILIDIVGFSKSSTREQVYNIYLFQRYLVSQVLSNKFQLDKKIHIDHFIPTGDGCYIVADECSQDIALNFLLALVGGFQSLVNDDGEHLSLRASALIGSCVPFIDIAKHKNYVGEGMNEAARILSYGQKALEDDFLAKNPQSQIIDSKKFSRNSLYLGDSLAFNIQEYTEECKEIYNFNDVSDKHGMKRNITVLRAVLS